MRRIPIIMNTNEDEFIRYKATSRDIMVDMIYQLTSVLS